MVVKNGNTREIEIVKRFADFGFQVQPEVIELLSQYEDERHFDLNAIVESVTDSLNPSVFVISSEQITEIIKNNGAGEKDNSIGTQTQVPAIIKSFCDNGQGVDHKDFLPHFLGRYEKISGIIKSRVHCRPIRVIKKGSGSKEVSVVGMVTSINKTAKGNLRVVLEDPTGHLPVILQRQEEIIPDEVIGVTGSLLDGGYLFGNRVIHPDVPIPSSMSQSSLHLSFNSNHDSNKAHIRESTAENTYAVFISDMHVGSNTFLEESWNSFVQWLKEEAKRIGIAYMVVAGDIVDGIGVYPNQEEDLSIMDIEEQYKVAARYFHNLPSHIHVVIAPGNHDAVRNAEPQLPLPENIRKLFPDKTYFVSNPAYINIGGRLVLIYHGQSYDDFVNLVSRLSYSKPEEVMAEMLKRRHVAPIFGNSVSIVPDGHDYGIIDPVPDIFHCGHAHTVGVSKYRNVLLINSGTWQSQTPFQKKMGTNPVHSCATLVELSELKPKVMDFRSQVGA